MSSVASQGPAATQRDPAATIAALHQALTLMPNNVDAMVALGGLYLRSGRLDDAAFWCNQALARKPAHAPAVNILEAVGNGYVDAGMSVAVRGDLANAIDIFTRAVRDCRHELARSYLALFRRTETWFAQAASLPREAESLRLSLAVWGETYLRAVTTLIRSLLAPGNLPAMAAIGPVHLEISTDTAGRDFLNATPELAALRQVAQVDYFLIDDDILSYDRARLPGFQYWVMACVHYASVIRGRHSGAHVSFLTADAIVADGSLAAARRYIDAGKAAVMYAGLEVERDNFMAAIGDDGVSVLSIPPRDLVGHALAHLHPDTTALILEPGKATAAAIPHPVTFRVDGGIVQHGFHLAPLIMAASLVARDFTPDFLTADTRLTRLALAGAAPEEQLQVIRDTDEIAVVSMNRQMPKAMQVRPFNAEDVGVWAARWCFDLADVPYFEFLFRQRRAMRGPDAPASVTPESDFERAVLETTLSAFRRSAIQSAKRR